MKHSDFVEKHAWMCGLEEYFSFTEHTKDYDLFFKALYHDNGYRKRDLLLEMHKRIRTDGWVNDDVLRSYYSTVLHQDLPDYVVKSRALIGLINWFVKNDLMIPRINRFLTYYADQNQEVPNLTDFFSRGQVKSKLWLISELAKVVEGPIGNIVCYGGWYNFLAHFLFNYFDVNNIYSIDLDENVLGPSKRLYADEHAQKRFWPIAYDVNKVRWEDKKLLILDQEVKKEQTLKWHDKNNEKLRQGVITEQDKQEAYESFGYKNIASYQRIKEITENHFLSPVQKQDQISYLDNQEINLVINTSCEHMDNNWFHSLPDGTFVVLHQNDYFENEQHVNCCKDLEEVKQKYPMRQIHYEGSLDTQLYNRFMLIGIK